MYHWTKTGNTVKFGKELIRITKPSRPLWPMIEGLQSKPTEPSQKIPENGEYTLRQLVELGLIQEGTPPQVNQAGQQSVLENRVVLLEKLVTDQLTLNDKTKSIDVPGGKEENMYKVPLEISDGSQVWVTGKTLPILCENYYQKKSKAEAINTSKKDCKGLTFNAFADKCLKLNEDGGMKPTSLKTKKYRLNMLRPYIGEKPITDITKADLQNAINALGKEGTAHDTIKRVIGECKGIFKEALDNRLIDYSPAEKIKNPIKKPLQEQGYTEEEYAKLITEVLPNIPDTEPMLRYLIAISLTLGARTQEIAALTRDDFDFTDIEKPMVSITKRAVWIGNKAHLEEGTKTEAGVRTLPIESWAIPYIKPVVDSSVNGFILRGKCNKDGRSLVSWSFMTSLYKKSDKFTVPVIGKPFKCYQGRHTKATIMDNAGVGGVSMADFMGHSDTTGNFTRSQYAKRKSLSTLKTSEKTEDYLKKLIAG